MGLMLLLTACSVKKLHTEKLKDMEFTVMETEDLPKELRKRIEEKKTEPMMMTYSDKEWKYIVRGYGTKEKTGYRIAVRKCYEEEQSIMLETELLGPERKNVTEDKKMYPYVVLKIENVDKPVVFE